MLRQAVLDIREVGNSLEQMARSLVESGDYRVTSRLEPQAEYHPPDNTPKLVAAVVDVETTGTNPDSDKIIELGICLFEYDRQSGRIYKVLGSWRWLEDSGFPIPPEITTITGISDEMVADHSIDDRAVNDLLGRVVLVIAHNASFDRRFLERRLPAFATKHWACSRSDIDWKNEGIRSSALEFVAYSLGFFHDGHRAASISLECPVDRSGRRWNGVMTPDVFGRGRTIRLCSGSAGVFFWASADHPAYWRSIDPHHTKLRTRSRLTTRAATRGT
jgi:DNA polymerase-3 subunit epsilon